MDVQVRGGAFKRTGAMFEYLGAFVAPKLSMAAQEEIGRIILDRALQLVPVRTGSLRASGRVVKSQDRKSIEVRFGTSRVRYAQVVEYGTHVVRTIPTQAISPSRRQVRHETLGASRIGETNQSSQRQHTEGHKMSEKAAVSGTVKKALAEKAKKHNEKQTAATKKTSTRTLVAVFKRGVGAYNTNPSSVRPTVSSADQWAYARVNSFLYALRNGRFRSGKHDTDLFPKGHPLSSKSFETKAPKTNFPKRGGDDKVSLANSEYAQFPAGLRSQIERGAP